MVAAGAVSASFLGNYMNKHGIRGVVLVSALWCGAGAWVFSFSNALWMFYVAVRQLFGGQDYAAIWSVVITCSSVASFLATPGWGMVYDLFDTYAPALIAMPVLLTLAVAALTMAFRKAK